MQGNGKETVNPFTTAQCKAAKRAYLTLKRPGFWNRGASR